MTISDSLRQAIDRLFIADAVAKSIATSLAPSVIPGVNVQLTDTASFQMMTPICESVATFDSAQDPDSRLVVFEVRAGIRMFRGPARDMSGLSEQEVAEAILATIEATFLVSYTETKKDDGFLEEDALFEFAIANVPFNVWPYWRELVQSACSRMSLPRIVLPAHRLKKREVDPQAIARHPLRKSVSQANH